MRILHVTKKYPNALGGDAIVVQNLEKQQTKNGHQVFILTTNCEDIINKDNLIKFGLKDTPANLDRITLKRILSLIGLYFKASNILKEIKPDIVHCHSVDMGYIMSKACRKYKIPLINHFHGGLMSLKEIDSIRASSERFFIKHSNFDKMITVNPNDLDSNVYPNLIFVPNGIDLDVFNNKNKVHKNNKKVNLLFVGRVEEAKGLTYLINAVKEVINTYKEIQLKIIGQGKDLEYYKDLVNELKLQDYVGFEGKKTQKELVSYYQNSDIFILPSLDEGFPVSMLEAWASYLPIIITDVGAISKVCTNNKDALIILPRDKEALKDAMIKLIKKNELRKKLGENARILVEQKYTWEKINKEIEKRYIQILKNS